MAEVPPNAPIYQVDQSIRDYETTVKKLTTIDALNEDDKALFAKAKDASHVLETKQTIFHPQGGGQPSDRGMMRSVDAAEDLQSFNVTLARHSVASPGSILHAGKFEDGAPDGGQFQVGKTIRQQVDSEARDFHSRIHTGGHLIGFAVHALRDTIGQVGEGKASHYPDMANVEFIGLIGGEHKAAIQAKVDEYIAADRAVLIEFLNEAQATERCTAMPDVIKGDQDGFVRVVAVEGLGAYPCGGTHLSTTKQVGAVEVRHIRRKNGITKITYQVAP